MSRGERGRRGGEGRGKDAKGGVRRCPCRKRTDTPRAVFQRRYTACTSAYAALEMPIRLEAQRNSRPFRRSKSRSSPRQHRRGEEGYGRTEAMLRKQREGSLRDENRSPSGGTTRCGLQPDEIPDSCWPVHPACTDRGFSGNQGLKFFFFLFLILFLFFIICRLEWVLGNGHTRTQQASDTTLRGRDTIRSPSMVFFLFFWFRFIADIISYRFLSPLSTRVFGVAVGSSKKSGGFGFNNDKTCGFWISVGTRKNHF